ncbi:hypothetical protein [Nocardioides sp. Kera G14]|uniref:hypothetical protein n=1 Tax=Nocardioides sp. Kera G14 TaxID=2884264 RepID=UPI001D0FE8C9|nr:hypothetical protein [Nocardioides sp. Kera G14]UDY24696.1 hypothetical protein LH076_05170 [Nocardioides sp. Kera G14]
MNIGRKTLLAGGIALAGSLAISACSTPNPLKKDDGGESPSAQASTATQVTVAAVTGKLDQAGRDKLSAAVTTVVDTYLDAAYLGDFPRADFGGAFAAFTDGAKAKAQGDLDLLTSSALSDQIDHAEATARRVSLDVLSPKNVPSGVTARWSLTFETTGSLTSTQQVRGSLALTPDDSGSWKVFGYTVEHGPAVPLATGTPASPSSEVTQ